MYMYLHSRSRHPSPPDVRMATRANVFRTHTTRDFPFRFVRNVDPNTVVSGPWNGRVVRRNRFFRRFDGFFVRVSDAKRSDETENRYSRPTAEHAVFSFSFRSSHTLALCPSRARAHAPVGV